MVSATRAPNTAAVMEHRWAPRIVSGLGSIDRTICSVSSKLRRQRDVISRVPLIWLCRFVDRGGDDMGRIEGLAADHQLPGDAGHLVGQCHGSEFGRLALQQLDKPRRGMALCSLPGASFAASHLLDHRGRADHQYAAQGLIAGAGDAAEPRLAGRRVIFWCQPDPGREMPAGSEGFGLATFMTNRVAPIGPMPGIFTRRRLASFCRCQVISLASITSSCACNWAYSLAC